MLQLFNKNHIIFGMKVIAEFFIEVSVHSSWEYIFSQRQWTIFALEKKTYASENGKFS